ncbi:hypothetical protein Tco_0531381 [Tanacetum coccineum]
MCRDSSRSGNDTNADDAYIRPIYDEESSMAGGKFTAECNIFAIGQQHTEQPKIIIEGHRFSPNKTSAVSEKTSPRSDLRWKPTGRIFKSVGLRWIPTGKLFDSCTSKVDSTSINVQKEQSLDLSVGTLRNVINENLRIKPRTSMSNDVCSQQFRPQTSMSNDVCSQQFRPQTSMSNDV